MRRALAILALFSVYPIAVVIDLVSEAIFLDEPPNKDAPAATSFS